MASDGEPPTQLIMERTVAPKRVARLYDFPARKACHVAMQDPLRRRRSPPAVRKSNIF